MSIATEAPPTTAAPRPTSITAAFWLLIASGALVVAGAATSVAAVLSPEGTAALRESVIATPGALEGEISLDTLVSVSQATAIGIQLLLAVLSLLVVLGIAAALRAGRRYVRVIATALVALQAIGTAAAPSLLSVTSLLLVLGAVALSWTAPSSRYIAVRTAARSGAATPLAAA